MIIIRAFTRIMNLINREMSKNLNSGTQAKTSPVEVEAKHSGSFGGSDKF